MGEGTETEGDMIEDEGEEEGEGGEEEVGERGEIDHEVGRGKGLRKKDRLFLDYHGFSGNDVFDVILKAIVIECVNSEGYLN